MVTEKKLYRARNTIGGGVCTGIADYFNIDPVIVQILAVVFTVATAGLFIVAYIALWVIVPRVPDPDEPVVVTPHEVHSDTYGSASSASPQETVPFPSGSPVTPGPGVPQTPYPSSAPPSQTHDCATAPVAPPETQPEAKATSGSAGVALWFGFILLFIGVSALLGTFVHGVEWWQFWPLILVIAGIGEMVVPGKKGHRMSGFVGGLTQLALGVSALPFSLGIVSLHSLESILTNLWPLLVIVGGLYVLGGALNAPLITLLAGVCFVAFCVFGLMWYSYPGPTDFIILTLPTSQVYVFDLNPWR